MQISIIEILKAILFGIVEGVTEWLPVSSTGHMILLNEFVKLDVSPEFWNLFLVVIQLGAILAVIIMYWNTIWPIRTANWRRMPCRRIRSMTTPKRTAPHSRSF